MKRLIRKVTWKNSVWFARVNVVGWLLQGVVMGSLLVLGLDQVSALISAKVASWVVFIGQCVRKYK